MVSARAIRLIKELFQTTTGAIERRAIGGFSLFLLPEEYTHFLIFWSRKSARPFLRAIDPDTARWYLRTASNRMMAMINAPITCQTLAEAELEFPVSFIFSPQYLLGCTASYRKDTRFILGIQPHDQVPEKIIEALFVGYFCHEIRHYFQYLVAGDSLDSWPELFFNKHDARAAASCVTNGGPSRFTQYWHLQLDVQLPEYASVYNGDAADITLEEDAIHAQILATDCWLSDRPRSERLAELRTLVQTFRVSV